MSDQIRHIRITDPVMVGGEALASGRVLAVPKKISLADAEALIRMGRAVIDDGKRRKPAE